MSETLKTASILLNIKWGDVTANLAETKRLIELLPRDYDIALLPEMFSTGFICNEVEARAVAEEMDGTTMTFIRRLSKERNIALCGSFIARDGDKLYNRGFFVEPSGDEYFYDKHHLFTLGGEHSVYSPGKDRVPVFRYRGWNIAMAICYDLRFPVWLRNDRGAYDLLLIMANWPDSRSYAWQHLLIARAIENQCYVVSCNCKGEDNFGTYSGISPAIDPKGMTIDMEYADNILTAELSHSQLMRFREKFPVYRENDPFTLL